MITIVQKKAQTTISLGSRDMTLTASEWTCGYIRKMLRGDWDVKQTQKHIDAHNKQGE